MPSKSKVKTVKITTKTEKNSNKIVMPIATASWLLKNTSLTFEQIAKFCDMYVMEVAAIENGSLGANVIPSNPLNIYVTKEEIEKCQQDHSRELQILDDVLKGLAVKKPKVKKYTPMLQRRNRLDAVLWLVTFLPQLSDQQVAKLASSTVKTVSSIRTKTHRSFKDLTATNPVILGLCAQKELDLEVEKSKK